MSEDTIEDRLDRLSQQLEGMQPTPVNLNEGLQALTRIVADVTVTINKLGAVARSSSAVFNNLIKVVKLPESQQQELIHDNRSHQRRED